MNQNVINTGAITVIMVALAALGGLFFFGTYQVPAQDDNVCAAKLEHWYVLASEACIGGVNGHICNAGYAPQGEPAGPVISSLAQLGALVPVDEVSMLHTPPIAYDGSAGGLAWIRVQSTGSSALMLGDVIARNVTPPDFPAWQSIVVQTSEEPPPCVDAPHNVFVAQNYTPFQPTRLVVNGMSLDLNGTVMIKTIGTQTVYILLEGRMRVITSGQTQDVPGGMEVRVNYAEGDFSRPISAISDPAPFDPALIRNFPVELLDRPSLLPAPGIVQTEGAVNMRSEPTTDGGLIFQVPPGQTMNVLGTDPSGEWLHVRLVTGQTGWMYADLLRASLGEVSRVYQATPSPPQRLGNVGYNATVQAAVGVNLRSAPDTGFASIASLAPGQTVNLVARSPYSPWVKVDANGVVGWVALITLDTQAIIDSLPIDFDVPPPPSPTREPGSWGGAFPDPRCYPNC